MSPERWQRIKSVLAVALETDPGARPSYLDRACADDLTLRFEIESLLANEEQAQSTLLESPVIQNTLESDVNARLGQRIGPYQLVEEIGAGGMGEVYRALRVDDHYQKEVAIKLVRSGQDSKFVIARFKNERQVLAALDHPNIARLLDGGTTDDGIPYFVMELIAGEPLTHYCRLHQLTTTERLKVFLLVCSAVQYAHQRLIIHRDLKPSNIMVTADGVPKLLDFGIAKIMDSAASAAGIEKTTSMFRLLTPAYASPEQVNGGSITTASDVYSLGVVLYECLTGCSPYGSGAHTPNTLSRAVCDVEPEKPSVAIRPTESRIRNRAWSTSKRMSPGRDTADAARRLRGDIDNIVLMALRKDPQRRYASVEQFAEDIRHHLEMRPVIARRDTVRYRAAKFIARHKVGISAATTVALVLVAGIAMTVREERIAQRRFNDVRALANSLIFDVHDSIKDLPGSTPARKMIVERALQYLNALSAESRGDIGLQRELATAYERVGMVQGHYLQDNLGDTAGSLSSYQRALDLRKQVASKSRDWNDRLALAEAHRLVADLLWTVGNNPDARKTIDAAIHMSEALNSAHPNESGILYELGFDYSVSYQIGYAGDPNERSERLSDLKKSAAINQAALRINPDDVSFLHASAVDLVRLSSATEGSDPSAALAYAQQAAAIEQGLTRKSNASKYARELAIAYLQIASAYDDLGNYARSVENNQQYLAMYLKINASDPKNVLLRQGLAIAYANTASAEVKVGQIQTAVEDWNRGAEIMRDLVSKAPENVRQRHKLAEITGVGGSIFMRAHRPDTALKYFREARDLYQSLTPMGDEDRANMAFCVEKMAEAAALSGEGQSADSYFHEALRTVEPLISNSDQNLTALYTAADAYSGLGDLIFRKGLGHAPEKADIAEARAWYLKSSDAWRRIAHPNRSGPNGIEVGSPNIVATKLRRCDEILRH